MKKIKKPRIFKCRSCGVKSTPDNPVTYAPDPYREEINEDYTKVRMCASCRYESAQDI